MEKVFIIKKNGEMYWNLNTVYKHKSRARMALKIHLESLVPRVNGYRKERIPHCYKEMTVEEFARDFEIVCIEV